MTGPTQRFNLADIPLTRPVIQEVSRRLLETETQASVHLHRTERTVLFDVERGLWVIDHGERKPSVRCLACPNHTTLRYEFLVEDLEGVFHGPLGGTCLFRRALGSEETAFRFGRSLEAALRRSLKERHSLQHQRLLAEAGNVRAYLQRLELGWVIEAAVVGSDLLPTRLRREVLHFLDGTSFLPELLYKALQDASELRKARQRAAASRHTPGHEIALRVRVPSDLRPSKPSVRSPYPRPVPTAVSHHPVPPSESRAPRSEPEFKAAVRRQHTKQLFSDPARDLLAQVRPLPLPAAPEHAEPDEFEVWLQQDARRQQAISSWRLIRPFTPPNVQKAVTRAIQRRQPLNEALATKLLIASQTYHAIRQDPELIRRKIPHLNRGEMLRRLQQGVELTDEQAQMLIRAYLEALRARSQAALRERPS